MKPSKAPREQCLAFDKIDGSNVRFKWTQKQSFSTFGTRTQLIDANTETFGEAVTIFLDKHADTLDKYFRKDSTCRNEREIIVFGEFHGDNSFAGQHIAEPHRITFFDVLVGHKNRHFVKPVDFISDFQECIPIPDLIYQGKLNDEFIQDVRDNKFNLNEGVICKGVTNNGAYRGNVWMCKVKTTKYFEKLYEAKLDLAVYGE